MTRRGEPNRVFALIGQGASLLLMARRVSDLNWGKHNADSGDIDAPEPTWDTRIRSYYIPSFLV